MVAAAAARTMMIIIITSRDESAEIGTAANDLSLSSGLSLRRPRAAAAVDAADHSPRLYSAVGTDVHAASWTTIHSVVQYRSDRLHRIRVEWRGAGASVRRLTVIILLFTA